MRPIFHRLPHGLRLLSSLALLLCLPFVMAACGDANLGLDPVPHAQIAVQDTTRYEDGQLCIDVKLTASRDVQMKYFYLEVMGSSAWKLFSEGTVVGAPWNVSVDAKASGDDSALIGFYFDDDTSNGVTVAKGEYTFTIKVPVNLPIDVSELTFRTVSGKYDSHLYESSKGTLQDNVVKIPLPAASRVARTVQTLPPTFAPSPWDPIPSTYVEIARLAVTITGGPATCTALKLWNVSEDRLSVGQIRIDQVVAGQPSAMVGLASATGLFTTATFTTPLMIADTAELIVSARAASLAGLQGFALSIECDSQNAPDLHVVRGGASLVIPTVAHGSVGPYDVIHPGSDELTPSPNMDFTPWDTINATFVSPTDPASYGKLRWRLIANGLVIDRGGSYCEQIGGPDYTCNVAIEPSAHANGYRFDYTTATLVWGNDEPMTEEYQRDELTFTEAP